MNFLEKDLETIIWEAFNKDPEILSKRGLDMYGTGFRQLDLGGYGIADIVTMNLDKTIEVHPYAGRRVNRQITVDVYELKKDIINIDTFLQAIGYCKGIQRILDENYPSLEYLFKIHLIGKTIEKESNFCYMVDFIENVSIYTYKADLESGFTFQNRSGFTEVGESIGVVKNIYLPKIKELIRNQSEDITYLTIKE
jgi:hypothetical protein